MGSSAQPGVESEGVLAGGETECGPLSASGLNACHCPSGLGIQLLPSGSQAGNLKLFSFAFVLSL